MLNARFCKKNSFSNFFDINKEYDEIFLYL